jgi:hypothetical protein
MFRPNWLPSSDVQFPLQLVHLMMAASWVETCAVRIIGREECFRSAEYFNTPTNFHRDVEKCSYTVQQDAAVQYYNDLEGSKGGEGSMETEHTVVSNVALKSVRSQRMRTVLLNVLAKGKLDSAASSSENKNTALGAATVRLRAIFHNITLVHYVVSAYFTQKGRSEWPLSLKRWGRQFESHSGHGCLCAFILCLCCPVCRQRPCNGLIPRPRNPAHCVKD